MTKQVLFILDSLGIGGSEKKVINIANSLVHKSYGVHILYLNCPNILADRVSDDIYLSSLDRKQKVDARAILRYRMHLATYRVGSVVAVNLYPLFVHKMATLGMRNMPHLFVSINTMYEYMTSAKGRLQMHIYKSLLKRGCKIIFGSENQMRFWISKYGLAADYAQVIYNGIDTSYYSVQTMDVDRLALRERYRMAEDEIVLGMVSSFRPLKSNIDLIRACKILLSQGYNIKVLFAGDGPDFGKCIAASRDMNVADKIVFMGAVSDVRPALLLMDIFVLTSRSETFSNAVLEAMAMSKPVVLGDVGGASEMLSDGVNGFLYQPGNINDLASRIRTMIDNNSLDAMSRQSRKIVEKRFTIQEMVRKYENVIFSE